MTPVSGGEPDTGAWDFPPLQTDKSNGSSYLRCR